MMRMRSLVVPSARTNCEKSASGENAEFEGAFEKLMNKQKEKEKPKIQVLPWKGPPFWWKGEVPGEEESRSSNDRGHEWDGTCDHEFFTRWQEEPNLAACVQR
ncbi:hypothetical protein NQ317_012140 [Molorchus minor]|uniref:Uncharacterized protein n=1 Tax=Molorchus minor TaxID=1323400 RepID=A0ABQ9IQJ4_9CUCU|nr:hypothetical protein NQ317_012140 [Molorchus minor]